MRLVRCLDLFSGIGGFALACKWVGIETVAFCEIDPYCQRVLRKHWPNVPIHPDIRELKPEHVGPVELICGGFPCQPYSFAGKRQGAADDRDLWPEMLRCVREFRPAWVCAENVAGFVGMGLDPCLDDLGASGYDADAYLIPAMAVGAPHKRHRLFVVAYSESARQLRAKQPQDSLESGYGQGANDANQTRPSLADAEIQGLQISHRAGDSAEPRSQSSGWWATEPAVGRVAHGIPSRVDRLRSLGNAVVPQQVYPILKAIYDTHAMMALEAKGGPE